MIGILGGTFDPIHLGHLHISRRVLNRLSLDQVHFMPCAIPVHRSSPSASADARCAMIELAIGDEPGFVLDRVELMRDGPSFTVDSLATLRQKDLPGADTPMALILGTDAFNGFDRWKSPERILELAHLVICARPGSEVRADLFPQQRVDSPEDLAAGASGGILVLEVDAPDCASSRIRAALGQGGDTEQWLLPEVREYIDQHQLYRNGRD